MTIDLEPRHQHIVLAILRSRLPDASVRVFGSRARHTASARSDLDLIVEGDRPIAELVLAQLELDFADSDLPFRVDVLDGARLDDAFWRRIAPDLRSFPGASATDAAGTGRAIRERPRQPEPAS